MSLAVQNGVMDGRKVFTDSLPGDPSCAEQSMFVSVRLPLPRCARLRIDRVSGLKLHSLSEAEAQ
jgi:hypothetical protein